MNTETISRAQLLLQYYAALAELEQETRQSASRRPNPVCAGLGGSRVERIQPIFFEKEMRVSA
jgi:hypothetical protein